MKQLVFLFFIYFWLPVVSHGDSLFDTGTTTTGSLGYFSLSLRSIAKIMTDSLVGILIGAAFLFFIIGLIKYVIVGAADDEKRAQGKSMMIWATIGLVIMVSLFGILNLLSEIFNVTSSSSGTSTPNFIQYKSG